MAIGQNTSAVSIPGIALFPYNCALVVPTNGLLFDAPVAIFILGAGDIVVTPFGNASPANITFTVTAGMVANGPFTLPFMVKCVLATGTTATPILGVW